MFFASGLSLAGRHPAVRKWICEYQGHTVSDPPKSTILGACGLMSSEVHAPCVARLRSCSAISCLAAKWTVTRTQSFGYHMRPSRTGTVSGTGYGYTVCLVWNVHFCITNKSILLPIGGKIREKKVYMIIWSEFKMCSQKCLIWLFFFFNTQYIFSALCSKKRLNTLFR